MKHSTRQTWSRLAFALGCVVTGLIISALHHAAWTWGFIALTAFTVALAAYQFVKDRRIELAAYRAKHRP